MKCAKLVAVIVAVAFMTVETAWAIHADGNTKIDDATTIVSMVPVSDDFPGLLGRDVPDNVAAEVRGEVVPYVIFAAAVACVMWCMPVYELVDAYISGYQALKESLKSSKSSRRKK